MAGAATIEDALVSILKNATPTKSIFADRIQPLVVPEGERTYPVVAYQKIDTPRAHSHQGSSSLASPRIQFRVWAPEYGSAVAGADAIRLALQGKTFDPYVTSDGREISIQAILAADERDIYDDERRLFCRSIDFVVWHGEEKPA